MGKLSLSELTSEERERYLDYTQRGYARSKSLGLILGSRMREAVARLQRDDPKRYAELLKRAKDVGYDNKIRCVAEESRRREREEEYRRRNEEKLRVRRLPVIVGLPNVDMSRVSGMVAFRVWHCDAVGLASTAMRYHWKELNFADKVPTSHNQSGFYCIKLTGLGVLTTGADYFDTGRQDVSGFIELRGKVLEHSDGILRAEVAKLICLFVTSENESIGSVVGHLYELYPLTPVFVLNPEQLADVVMREVLRQKYVRGQE